MGERRARTLSETWKKAIQEQPKSGLTIADYCQRENLPRTSFFAWRSRLLDKKGFTRTDAGIKIKKHLPILAAADRNLPANDESPSVIKICTPNGYSVEITNCNSGNLRPVLSVLGVI